MHHRDADDAAAGRRGPDARPVGGRRSRRGGCRPGRGRRAATMSSDRRPSTTKLMVATRSCAAGAAPADHAHVVAGGEPRQQPRRQRFLVRRDQLEGIGAVMRGRARPDSPGCRRSPRPARSSRCPAGACRGRGRADEEVVQAVQLEQPLVAAPQHRLVRAEGLVEAVDVPVAAQAPARRRRGAAPRRRRRRRARRRRRGRRRAISGIGITVPRTLEQWVTQTRRVRGPSSRSSASRSSSRVEGRPAIRGPPRPAPSSARQGPMLDSWSTSVTTISSPGRSEGAMPRASCCSRNVVEAADDHFLRSGGADHARQSWPWRPATLRAACCEGS